MRLKKDPPWNVLVFPAASEIGFEICRALGASKEVVLHGANQSGLSLANFHFKRLHELPTIDSPDCLPRLRQLIVQERIDAIYPAYDDVLLWLSECATELGCVVIAPSPVTAAICRSKIKTYQALQEIVPVPDQWAANVDTVDFPVFVKPDKGQGSQRARRINNRPELNLACASEPDLLIMEYLPGREWTVDCFSQHGKGVLYAQARVRIQAKAGIATLTRPHHMPFARDWAERIGKYLNLQGGWFFQVKENAEGQPRLLEVGPRIAGSMASSRVLGPNFPLLSLYEAAGHDIRIDVIDADIPMGRSLDTHFIYDKPIEALYIDLDETLILHNEVNTLLVALVFQYRNRSIPVHLITRHKGDVDKILERFKLTHIFDRVIHLRDNMDVKANYISEKGAVLIDDSFSERHVTTQQLGIRCFDAAAAICLLDKRQ